ncbi:MAG: ECF transporter S component [Clostridia bacterium]|nr:ECF transporter S component [Clostridia bacterium]
MKRVDTRKFTVLAILIAVTLVLQIIATILPRLPGGIELSFVLIPVVVAACFYGYVGAATVGGAFGLIVFIMGLTGATPFTTYLIFEVNWFYTIIGTVVRTTAAALLVALVFKFVSKKLSQRSSYIVASIVAPVFNTGLFIIIFLIFFNPLLREYALANGYGDNVIGYVFAGFVGVNFFIELATTVLLAPPVCIALERVIRRKKS